MSSRVVMPKLSDTMEEGVLLKWYKHEGDRVESGDVLAEIETDKAVMDLEAYASGILKKVLVGEKAVVPAGGLIAVIANEDEEVSPDELKSGLKTIPEKQSEKSFPKETSSITGKRSGNGQEMVSTLRGEKLHASPLARSMAKEKGIELNLIQGSGPGGRIVKKDIESILKGPAIKQPSVVFPTVEKGFQDQPLSMMRKSIISKMVQSKAPVPHFYITSEVAMGECLAMKDSLETLGDEIQIGITDFWIRAAAIAMKKFPQINASFLSDKIRSHGSVDIGIAVGLEEGLIVPVLRHCEQKGLRQIAIESRTLIERARTRKLAPEEYTGATFSISNLGMVDVENFVAIITPPESAALALGNIREVPIVKDGKIEVASRMKATLSCDHRVIDGLQAAQFLKECKKILEHPVLLTV